MVIKKKGRDTVAICGHMCWVFFFFWFAFDHALAPQYGLLKVSERNLCYVACFSLRNRKHAFNSHKNNH